MPRKGQPGYTGPGDPDPPPVDSEAALIAELRDLEKAISEHERNRREIPLRVLGPQLAEALTRVRAKIGELAFTPLKAAVELEQFPVGQKVGVEMSPLQSGIVLGPAVDPRTGKEARLLLLEDGRRVIAPLDEILPVATLETVPGPTLSSPGPLPTGPEKPQPSSVTPLPGAHQSFRPGDLVTSPVGQVRVLQEDPPGSGTFKVEQPDRQTTYFFSREQLSQAATAT